MTEQTIRLLVPTAETTAASVQLAARPAVLQRVAFLHNGQPYYDELAPQLVARLASRPGLTLHQSRKPRYSSPAEAEVLDEIRTSADAAIVGLAC
jgi:hypothetical protein